MARRYKTPHTRKREAMSSYIMKNGVLSKTDRNLIEESGWGDETQQSNQYPGYIPYDKIDFGCGVIEIFTRNDCAKHESTYGKALVDFTFLVDLDLYGRNMLIGVVDDIDMLELQVKLTALAQYKELQQRHFEAERSA
jgi:hypothetical protein